MKKYSKIETRKNDREVRKLKTLKKKLQILTLILTAGLLFASATIPAEAFITKAGTIKTAVTLRQNADASSAQVMELSSGQNVKVNNEITSADGTKWYQVLVNDTSIGYVLASAVELGESGTEQPATTTPSDTQTITVTERVGTVTAGSAVRVRSEASTSSNQVATMNPNDTFLVLEDVKAADGYTWHKIEFDNNGTTVNGYVRSDLVTVKEVTHEEQVPVETPSTEPTTPSETPTVQSPYTIKSEVNAEGTEVWYLVTNATGDSKEITSLLTPQKQVSGNTGVYKVIVVVLLILVVLAIGAATFFYMRWQDAEAFIYEIRDKQMRTKKQPSAGTGRSVPEKQQTAKQAEPKQATRPVSKPSAPAAKPATQPKPAAPTASAKPTATRPVRTENTAAPKREVKPAVKPEVRKSVSLDAKSEAKEVAPSTTDIVSATKKELQQKQATPAKSDKWKSKNFLTDDDDLEFDFLDMDDK